MYNYIHLCLEWKAKLAFHDLSSWVYNVSSHAQTIHWKEGVKLCILSTSRIWLEWHGCIQRGNILGFFQIDIDQVLKWLLEAPFQIPKHHCIINIWINVFFIQARLFSRPGSCIHTFPCLVLESVSELVGANFSPGRSSLLCNVLPQVSQQHQHFFSFFHTAQRHCHFKLLKLYQFNWRQLTQCTFRLEPT